MVFDLTPAIVVALVVGVSRLMRHRRRGVTGPLPDVGDAPPEAKPIASLRLSQDGLVTYVLDDPKPADPRASGTLSGR